MPAQETTTKKEEIQIKDDGEKSKRFLEYVKSKEDEMRQC